MKADSMQTRTTAAKSKWRSEKFRDGQSRIGCGGRVGVKGEVILTRDFDPSDGEDHDVGVIDVEHEASDHAEDQPLRERAVTPAAPPMGTSRRASRLTIQMALTRAAPSAMRMPTSRVPR